MSKKTNNRDIGANRHTQSANQSAISADKGEQLIYQKKPRPNSALGWEHRPSFTHSLQSYELAAKKQFILLMRNLAETKQYPGYHVIINFKERMSIKNFAKKRVKAHGYLTKWGVCGYYVQEPTESRNWLHLHMLTIYNGSRSDLKKCIKYAWMMTGLTYGKDFRVKVFPVGATDKDYQRTCCYILKYSGKRKTNRFTPKLFIKNLGLRKTGSFGGWFAKTKKTIWNEYREELRLKREQQAGQSKPNQPVVVEELFTPPANQSQQAMEAHDFWESAKTNSDISKMKQVEVAKRFNVGITMVRHAGRVKKSASEKVQRAVREGTLCLRKVVDVIEEVAEKTGILVAKNTTESDKQKAFEAQERILYEDPEEQKRRRNISKIQKAFTRLPELFNECDEMLAQLDRDALHYTMLGIQIEATKQAVAMLQRDEISNVSDFKKIIMDLALDKLQVTAKVEDIGQVGKRELLEFLKQQFIDNCEKCLNMMGGWTKASMTAGGEATQTLSAEL